jgi:hypothetical protein
MISQGIIEQRIVVDTSNRYLGKLAGRARHTSKQFVAKSSFVGF